MDQLWTIIFFTVLAAAYGLASWYDRENARKRERRAARFGEGAGTVAVPPGGAPARDIGAGGRGLTVRGVWKKMYERRRAGYLTAVLGILAVTGLFKLFGPHANTTTVALGLLLVVLFVAAALKRAALLTRGHEVLVRIEEGLPSVRVDAKAVTEVVYTLLDNAAKYSSAGTRIAVSANSSGDESVRLCVEDEGPGVPSELRERVFDKFFRATRDGDSGTHQPPGTGMGLAIAKGIVEAHGGRIRIEDARRGHGSRVVVTLPLGDDEEGAPEGAGVSMVGEVDGREAAHTHRR